VGAQVPVLTQALQLHLLRAVDQFELLGGVQDGALDAEHDGHGAGLPGGLGPLDVHDQAPRITLPVLLEDLRLVDQIRAHHRPGQHDCRPGGTGGVAAVRLLHQRPQLSSSITTPTDRGRSNRAPGQHAGRHTTCRRI
jgi:hypothetical protein